MNSETDIVEVTLPNGASAFIEVRAMGGEEDVAFDFLSLDKVMETVEGISDSILGTIKKVKPSKATIEFGVEIGLESGELTALIVKGEGKANLNISLEWEENKQK